MPLCPLGAGGLGLAGDDACNRRSCLAWLATAWAIFQGLLIEALPFLLIGVAIASLARWLAPGGRWMQKLPRHPVLGPLTGAALGFALPACECGNVPVAR